MEYPAEPIELIARTRHSCKLTATAVPSGIKDFEQESAAAYLAISRIRTPHSHEFGYQDP